MSDVCADVATVATVGELIWSTIQQYEEDNRTPTLVRCVVYRAQRACLHSRDHAGAANARLLAEDGRGGRQPRGYGA